MTEKKFPTGLSLKNDNWYAIIEMPPEQGHRVQKWVNLGKISKPAAIKARAKLIQDNDDGCLIIPTKLTLGQLLEAWLVHQVVRVRPKTLEGYRYIVKIHLIPALGSIRMAHLRASHIDNYYAEKLTSGRYNGKGGLSDTSVKSHHRLLHTALQWAMKSDLIKFNLMAKTTAPRVTRSEIKLPTRENILKFLDAARDTEYFEIFHTAIFTGMRRSEILGLKWADIDFITGEVNIRRSLHVLKGQVWDVQNTKTHRSKRPIRLTPQSLTVLQRFYDNQKALKTVLGIPMTDNDWVFAHIEKKGIRPYLPDTISNAWAKLAKAVGIDGFRLHDARHAHISILINAGIPVVVVQARAGHERGSTTTDIYGHVLGEAENAAAVTFDNVLRYDLDKS